MRGACARGLIRRRLLPDICSCCVSRNAPVSVLRKRLIVACRDLPITCFLSNFWGLVILKMFNIESRIYRTIVGNVTFIQVTFAKRHDIILFYPTSVIS